MKCRRRCGYSSAEYPVTLQQKSFNRVNSPSPAGERTGMFQRRLEQLVTWLESLILQLLFEEVRLRVELYPPTEMQT
jgi:hypothetical protein